MARDLSGRDYVYVWVDGIHTRERLGSDDRLCCLVMVGARLDGTKELVAITDGYRESTESWAELLRDLKKCGTRAPELAVGDGALGFWGAIRDVFPATRHQRDWVHKARNVLDSLPKSVHGRAKSAVRGAFLGFFVDMFDIHLPIVVLAPALIYFVSPELNATTASLVGASIFAATLVGRPLGAMIFGGLADTIGRKRTTIIAVSGFGVATLLLALMPGYEQWGIAAVIIFIVLRFVDGIFLGGEYTSASPLAMESSPQEKRGLYGALIMTGFPLAFAFISLMTMFLLFLIPSGGLGSPYVQWGWRIPFLFGAALAFAFVAYYALSVSESELWEEAAGIGGSPLRSLFSGDNLKNFLQVFVLMTGFWLTLNTVAAILPSLLADPVGLSETGVTVTLVVAFLAAAAGYVAAGVVSQRVGRRPFLIAIGVVMATVGAFLYYLLISAAPDNLLVVIFLASVIVVLCISNWGLATVYINERFHISVRASGFGLGYSLAVVLPSFYAFYQAGLSSFMPAQYTVLVLLVVGGLLISAGAAWGPETKDVDFSEDAATPEETAGTHTAASPRAATGREVGPPGGS